MQPTPKSLQEVRQKRNDFLHALQTGQRDRSKLIVLPGQEDDAHDLYAFAVQVLTWVLGEDHLPARHWNTDTSLPVGTWRQYEEPQDPVGLRVIG